MKYREEISNMMAKRRHEVLEVAFTLFAERTIEKVSVNDIASATGIGVATIFRYFGDEAVALRGAGRAQVESVCKGDSTKL